MRRVTPFSLLAPAKINLALHVLGRRSDGYHDLDSIVAFADRGDVLSFRPAQSFDITPTGPFGGNLPPLADNIISRAWTIAGEIAARRRRILPPVTVQLEKNLPVASGIGGGSANAAAALRGFLRLAGIDDLDDEIMAAGLGIGADVPVCLAGVACRMRGVGEHLTPLAGFGPLQAILVNPLVAVSTPDVFRSLGLSKGQGFGSAIADERNPAQWRNDLAPPAIVLAPVIGEILERLRSTTGVLRAFMSGSGATCVAICETPDVTPHLDPRWWMMRTVLA